MKQQNALVGALSSRNAITENGALTNSTVGTSLLDFFGLGGALRSRGDDEISRIFSHAFGEDNLLALKTLFYFRDVRKGQGERRTFRVALKYLATLRPDVVRANLSNVAFYGRWDDLFVLFGTPVEKDMTNLIQNQLMADMAQPDRTKVSLLAKWMPSINTSSDQTRVMAYDFAKAFDVSPREYRKMLSHLRSELNLVENAMTHNEWAGINYEHVPSKAMTLYRKAFSKHDATRFVAYLNAVEKGEAKINSAVSTPYDLVVKVYKSTGEDKVLEAQWNALPNYCDDRKALVIADVSGSMGSPGHSPAITTCLALSLYMAERNTGPFQNYIMTFSDDSTFVKIGGNTLREKLKSIHDSDHRMSGSTNLQSSFNEILRVAIANNVPASDMPNTLFVISDMEFNSCTKGTNYDNIKAKYRAAGYELPEIVFWNVNARNDQSPITMNDKACLVSGYSPSILRAVLSGVQLTPTDVMLETINHERYDRVTLD